MTTEKTEEYIVLQRQIARTINTLIRLQNYLDGAAFVRVFGEREGKMQAEKFFVECNRNILKWYSTLREVDKGALLDAAFPGDSVRQNRWDPAKAAIYFGPGVDDGK